jgi:hypothetical protein
MVAGALAKLFRAGDRGHLGLETAPPARAGGGHLLGEP